MPPDSLFKKITQAEKIVSQEIEQAEQNRLALIDTHRGTTRKRAKETLEETPEMKNVRENIERLQLRLELIRNIKMNWRGFQGSLKRKGMQMRINQDAHLEHLITFLETGRGQPVDTEEDGPALHDIDRSLMTYEVQPTGAGKTGAFAIDIALMDVPTLTLVPFDNLLDQTKKDMMKIGGIPENQIGIVGGGTKEIGRKHTIATYAGHSALMRKGGEYATFIKTQCKLVNCDEVHHQALGERMQESITEIDAPQNGDAEEEREMIEAERETLTHLAEQTGVKSLKIAWTATPRGSKKAVRQFFPHFLGRVYHREMVEAGLVVPFKIIQCDGSVYEGELSGYLSEEKEAAILEREGIYGKLAGEYAEVLQTYSHTQKKMKHRMPLRGMGFFTNHAECEKFVTEAEAHGLKCCIVTGKEAKGRAGQAVINEAVDALSRGDIDLIVSVEKLATGFNREEINAIISGRITSAAKTIQYVGRGARSYTDEEGRVKEDCLVFETNWTLKKNAKRGRKPMRFADALDFNGEDPEAICTMADGSTVCVDRPKTKEEVIALIKAAYTPDIWANLKAKDRAGSDFAGSGIGLRSIASLFNIDGNPCAITAAHHQLGEAIWGENYGNPESKKRERVRSLIREKYTPESWSKIPKDDRLGANFCNTGKGIYAIASLFNVDGNPHASTAAHHQLGKAIWPENYGDPEDKERERVRLLIQERYTPESWAKIDNEDRQGINFAGTEFGLAAIATLFNIEGHAKSTVARHQLGRAIWPENYGDPEDKERERVRLLIQERYTPESWSQLKSKDREGANFAGTGFGIVGIATLFKLEGDPVKHAVVHHQLGKAIWPENYGDPEDKERERVRLLIQERYTPESWAKIDNEDRQGINFAGTEFGLAAIATLFNIEGHAKSTVARHQLGRAIWPENYGDPEDKERERVRLLIQERYTPESWSQLSKIERKGLNFAQIGSGLTALARLFGIEGDPIDCREPRQLLGRAIFGDHPSFSQDKKSKT